MALANHTLDHKSRNGRKKNRRHPGRVVSPGVAEIPGKGLGFIKGFLARDPDGHGLQLIEK